MRNQNDLATPGRVIEIHGDRARVDFGGGTIREVDVSLVDARVGDYVLVHRGSAIQVLDQSEAERVLREWSER